MDRREFALRRYRQIVPEPVPYLRRTALRRLELWLTDDVCSLVDDYVRRSAFRDQATWVKRTIRTGCQTAERRQIDAVDDLLVRNAEALLELAAKARIKDGLAKMFPPRQIRLDGPVEITGLGSRRLSQQSIQVDELSLELAQVEQMASRSWSDLVNIDDYFEPVQEFVQTDAGERLQRGEFIVELNPQLHPVGNFVARCLLRRIDLRCATLNSLRAKLECVLKQCRRQYAGQAKSDKVWRSLQTARATVIKTHQTGSAHQLRDSCMILTQVYAAFAQVADLSWIGISADRIRASIVPLRHRVTGWQNAEVFDRIAVALGDLEKLYESAGPRQSEVEEAIASGGLVIDRSAQTVYWDRKVLEIDWRRHHKSWPFLVALADRVRLQSQVTEDDLFPEQVVSDSAIGVAKKRLRDLLPPQLGKLIIPGTDPRTYRLNLERAQVHLIG